MPLTEPCGRAGLAPAARVIAGYMVLNSLGNLRSQSRFERTVFAAATVVLAVLSALVALTGPGR